jgi:hypothetical protein
LQSARQSEEFFPDFTHFTQEQKLFRAQFSSCITSSQIIEDLTKDTTDYANVVGACYNIKNKSINLKALVSKVLIHAVSNLPAKNAITVIWNIQPDVPENIYSDFEMIY